MSMNAGVASATGSTTSTGSWAGLDVRRGDGDDGRALAWGRGVDEARGVGAAGFVAAADGVGAAGRGVAVGASTDPDAGESGAGERGVGAAASGLDASAEPVIDADADAMGPLAMGLAAIHPVNAMSKRISTNAEVTAAPAPASAPRWWTRPAIRHSSLVIGSHRRPRPAAAMQQG